MINLLNISDSEDIYQLIWELSESTHGGNLEENAQRMLDAMLPFRQEIANWGRARGTPDAYRAVVDYNLEMAEQCRLTGDEALESSCYTAARLYSRKLLKKTWKLEDFHLVCSIEYMKLNLLWEREDEGSGKMACMQLLNHAHGYANLNPQWDRVEYLEELATIYEVNAKWFGMYDPQGVWHEKCRIQARKLRMYLQSLNHRKELALLRDDYINAAQRYMNSYGDWDLKQARACLKRALNLMKRNPRLPHTRYLLPSCYDRIAQTYVEEEEYARIKTKQVYSEEKRVADRTKSKDYHLKALDAWLAFLRYQQRTGNKMDVTAMCLRDCYEALAEDFGCLPGEKNGKKAEKYRQKAAQIKT